MHVPELADLEALRDLAADVLKPGPGQKIMILVTDEEVAEPDHMVAVEGEPFVTGDDMRQLERDETISLLEHYIDLVEQGEVRHVALVAGVESNQTNMGTVQTAMSVGLEEHMALFLGGCSLLESHIKEVFSQAQYDEDEA